MNELKTETVLVTPKPQGGLALFERCRVQSGVINRSADLIHFRRGDKGRSVEANRET